MLPSGEGIGIETQKNAWRRSITVQNGLIPIAYRRDIRHGRILLGAFFLLGQVALVGPIAKRICTNEGFRSIHKLCIHILFLSLSHLHLYSCVAALGRADADRTCLPAVQHAHAGAWACVRPCMQKCLHLDPGGSIATPALVAPSTHPPDDDDAKDAPAIAQQRQRQRQRLPNSRTLSWSDW